MLYFDHFNHNFAYTCMKMAECYHRRGCIVINNFIRGKLCYENFVKYREAFHHDEKNIFMILINFDVEK